MRTGQARISCVQTAYRLISCCHYGTMPLHSAWALMCTYKCVIQQCISARDAMTLCCSDAKVYYSSFIGANTQMHVFSRQEHCMQDQGVTVPAAQKPCRFPSKQVSLTGLPKDDTAAFHDLGALPIPYFMILCQSPLRHAHLCWLQGVRSAVPAECLSPQHQGEGGTLPELQAGCLAATTDEQGIVGFGLGRGSNQVRDWQGSQREDCHDHEMQACCLWASQSG